jgi:hypothetical protein
MRRLASPLGCFPFVLALLAAINPGCDCAGESAGTCTFGCRDGGTCPTGFECVSGCCQCAVRAETCDDVDEDCDAIADDGLDATCACAPGGPGPSTEICNAVDDDCNTLVDDGLDPLVCPCAPGGVGSMPETCDGVDDDCDGTIDEGVGATEVCNTLDDDCDGTADDGLAPACPCAPGGPGPSTEVCNALDDDCDGIVDDGLDPMTCPCAPGGAGAMPETCNGVDDDCNGVADDGTMICGSASACACAPGGPGMSAEACNAIDDDCDGSVDDGLVGCACTMCGPSGAEVCNTLDDDCDGAADDGLDPIACPCAPGGAGPSTEVCNRADDDCDGTVDDGLTGCACAPGGPGPSAEVCNRLDDDCDTRVDEGVAACACAPGGPGASMEVCNRIDDDCDGMIDEINSRTGMPCRGFGEPCTMNSDCSSEQCTGDAFEMYCTERCAMVGSPGDCPTGYRCWDNPSAGGVDLCRRNYPRCGRDADCPAGQICAATCDDPGTAPITECRPRLGAVDAPGACTRHAECAANDCFRVGAPASGPRICTEVCASDADCTAGHRCVLVSYPACGGRGYIPRCLDACDCDAECPSGQLCQPYVHQVLPPVAATTVGACDISYGPLPPGGDCDNTMGLFCAHAICSRGGTGFCTQVCSATCGCPAGIGPCGPSTVTFPDLGPYPAMTCGTM